MRALLTRAEIYWRASLIVVLLAALTGTTARPAAAGGGVIPTIAILSVESDQSVTVQCYNFPANESFQVLMGPYGTLGIGGYDAGQIDTGSGGNFKVTFVIPVAMRGAERIAIRLESPVSGYYAYNWFYNDVNAGASGGVAMPAGFEPLPPWVIPTIAITGVKADKNVTIRTANYPKHDTFDVYMGPYGSYGIGGIKVGTLDSGNGGTMTATFKIPDALKGSSRIAIRLQSAYSGYYSYNWFYNNTYPPESAPTQPPPAGFEPLPWGVIPTITITGIKADKNVTIRTANYPKHDTFDVYMGPYGSYGIGGIKVGTLDSGNGGTMTATFKIPDALKGSSRIAIRLQSAYSGYYSYNWFYNNTYP